MQFKSKHNLNFEVAPYEIQLSDEIQWMRFRIGTCEGLWRATDAAYQILAFRNNEPNNGHFTDVLQWFENSCIRDKKCFEILEVMNDRLKSHLINKQGFKEYGSVNLRKICHT